MSIEPQQQKIAHQSALLLGNWLVDSGRMKSTNTEMDNEFTKRFLSAIERATKDAYNSGFHAALSGVKADVESQPQRSEQHFHNRDLIGDDQFTRDRDDPQHSEQQEWTVNYHELITPLGNRYHIEDDHKTASAASKRLKDEIVAALTAERQRRERETEHLRGIIKNQVASLQQRFGACKKHWTEIGMSEPRTSCPICDLLSALTAIGKHNKYCDENHSEFAMNVKIYDADLSLLHEHDAEILWEVVRLLASIFLSNGKSLLGGSPPPMWTPHVIAQVVAENIERNDAEVRKPLVHLLNDIRVFLTRYRNGVIEHAHALALTSQIDDALAKVKEPKP